MQRYLYNNARQRNEKDVRSLFLLHGVYIAVCVSHKRVFASKFDRQATFKLRMFS